jgi:hypothetical protein
MHFQLHLEVTTAPYHPSHVLCQLICLYLLVELVQVLGEDILVFSNPQGDINRSTRADGPFIRQSFRDFLDVSGCLILLFIQMHSSMVV